MDKGIHGIIENNSSVLFFSKEGCPYCVKLENELKDMCVPFIKHMVTKETDRNLIQELKSITGMGTFPMLYFGTKKIGGYTDFRSLRLIGSIEEKLNQIGIKIDSQF